MKQLIENLLKKAKKSKPEMAEFFGISPQGMHYKINNGAFDYADTQKMAEFLGMNFSDVSSYLNESADLPKTESEVYSISLSKLEQKYEELLREKDLRIKEKEFTISLLIEKTQRLENERTAVNFNERDTDEPVIIALNSLSPGVLLKQG